jgi:hypothetical protein
MLCIKNAISIVENDLSFYVGILNLAITGWEKKSKDVEFYKQKIKEPTKLYNINGLF